MELNWLKYFYEVARVQSVTQAGLHLRVSQPAVTKMIRHLESSLGYKLFVKVGRNIRLSSEGERLYQHCVPLFKRLEQVRGLGQELNSRWQGTIRIGASDNLCNYILPGVIQKLQTEIPLSDWLIYSGSSKEIKQRIIAGEIDLGLFYTELSLQEQGLLREAIVAEIPFVGVCSSRHGKSVSVQTLRKKKMTYVGVRFADYAHTLPEQWIVKNLKIPYAKNIQANSKETQKRIILEGTGFGLFPHFMVKSELADKSLTLIQGSKQPMSLRAVHRADESLTAASKLLIDSVKKAL